MTETKARPLREIAAEIRADWVDPRTGNSRINFGAVPYIRAMDELDSIHDAYGYDKGDDIVIRFLSNAGSWRGDTARRIKLELNAMLRGSDDL